MTRDHPAELGITLGLAAIRDVSLAELREA